MIEELLIKKFLLDNSTNQDNVLKGITDKMMKTIKVNNKDDSLPSWLDPVEAINDSITAPIDGVKEPALGIGSVLSSLSTSEGGDDTLGTLGGAAKGIGLGSSLGPLGMLAGAIVGGGLGFGQASQERLNSEKLGVEDNSNLKVAPTIYSFGKGGLIIDSQEYVPVQMEKDEKYVDVDFHIYDSKAEKSHDEMDADEVTDVVKANSFVFSNNKELDLKEFEDIKLGLGFANYDENGNYELLDIKFGDGFKKLGKMSASEAIDELRKEMPIIEREEGVDIFTEITNIENLKTRSTFINKLVELHETGKIKDDVTVNVPKFEFGGKVRASFDEYLKMLDTENDSTIELIDNQITATKKQTRNDKVRNSVSALAQLGTASLENVNVDPVLNSTKFVDGMFEEVAPSTIEAEQSRQFSDVNSVLGNLAAVNPNLAQMLAPRLMDKAIMGANQVGIKSGMENRNMSRQRYSFLNNTDTVNRRQRAKAEMASKDLISKRNEKITNSVSDFLSADSQIEANSVSAQGNLNLSLTNAQVANLDKRLAAQLGLSRFELQMLNNQEKLQMFKDAMTERAKQLESEKKNK